MNEQKRDKMKEKLKKMRKREIRARGEEVGVVSWWWWWGWGGDRKSLMPYVQ